METFSSVQLPYEVTLLSNASSAENSARQVQLPYEVTLLSNVLSA